MLFLLEAAVLCGLFTLLVVPSVYKNPLEWAGSFPPRLRERLQELGLVSKASRRFTPKELVRKGLTIVVSVVLLACVVVYLNGAGGFWKAFFLSYGLWLCVTWYDAFVIDCLWFCHSKRVRIPGTEDLERDYKNYGFHLCQSGIGSLLGLPVCLLVGASAKLLLLL